MSCIFFLALLMKGVLSSRFTIGWAKEWHRSRRSPRLVSRSIWTAAAQRPFTTIRLPPRSTSSPTRGFCFLSRNYRRLKLDRSWIAIVCHLILYIVWPQWWNRIEKDLVAERSLFNAHLHEINKSRNPSFFFLIQLRAIDLTHPEHDGCEQSRTFL